MTISDASGIGKRGQYDIRSVIRKFISLQILFALFFCHFLSSLHFLTTRIVPAADDHLYYISAKKRKKP